MDFVPGGQSPKLRKAISWRREEDLKHRLRPAGQASVSTPVTCPLSPLTTSHPPRNHGSMPRFLRHYVRDQHLMSLERLRFAKSPLSPPAQREHVDIRGPSEAALLRGLPSSRPQTRSTTPPSQIQIISQEGIDSTVVTGQIEYESWGHSRARCRPFLRGRGWLHNNSFEIAGL